MVFEVVPRNILLPQDGFFKEKLILLDLDQSIIGEKDEALKKEKILAVAKSRLKEERIDFTIYLDLEGAISYGKYRIETDLDKTLLSP